MILLLEVLGAWVLAGLVVSFVVGRLLSMLDRPQPDS